MLLDVLFRGGKPMMILMKKCGESSGKFVVDLGANVVEELLVIRTFLAMFEPISMGPHVPGGVEHKYDNL